MPRRVTNGLTAHASHSARRVARYAKPSGNEREGQKVAVNPRIKAWPDRTEIVRGDEILGRFIATVKNGKVHVEASIKKGLATPFAQAQPPNSDQLDKGSVPPTDPTDASPSESGLS
jgi:hypothetical protein